MGFGRDRQRDSDGSSPHDANIEIRYGALIAKVKKHDSHPGESFILQCLKLC
jgi:hypothetical protein